MPNLLRRLQTQFSFPCWLVSFLSQNRLYLWTFVTFRLVLVPNWGWGVLIVLWCDAMGDLGSGHPAHCVRIKNFIQAWGDLSVNLKKVVVFHYFRTWLLESAFKLWFIDSVQFPIHRAGIWAAPGFSRTNIIVDGIEREHVMWPVSVLSVTTRLRHRVETVTSHQISIIRVWLKCLYWTQNEFKSSIIDINALQ